jgi:hypothetical protein
MLLIGIKYRGLQSLQINVIIQFFIPKMVEHIKTVFLVQLMKSVHLDITTSTSANVEQLIVVVNMEKMVH